MWWIQASKPKTKQVAVSRDVVIDELKSWNWETTKSEEMQKPVGLPDTVT